MPADTTSPVDRRAARRAPSPLTLTRIDRDGAGRAPLRAASAAGIDLAAADPT